MKRHTLIPALALLCLAAACQPYTAPGTPTSPPNPAEIGLTMVADKVNAEATQAVVNMQFTATAQVVGATATQQVAWAQATGTQQARVDANATAEQKRADAQATQARIDADARATDQQRRADIQATQVRLDAEATQHQAVLDKQATQEMQGTATAGAYTMTALPTAQALTQIANEQVITLKDNEVEKSRQEIAELRATTFQRNVLPYIVVVALLGGALLWMIRRSRWTVIKNDDGDVEGFGHDETFIRPSLMPGPVLDLKAQTIPLLTDSANQSEIVKRDQALRALANMPVNPTSSGVQAFNDMFSGQKALPVVEVIQPDQVSEILEEIEGQVMEEG